MEQKQKTRTPTSSGPAEEHDALPTHVSERPDADELKAEMDDILDEIDEVLRGNEDLAEHFKQAGGE